jgi:hypothetical protein
MPHPVILDGTFISVVPSYAGNDNLRWLRKLEGRWYCGHSDLI